MRKWLFFLFTLLFLLNACSEKQVQSEPPKPNRPEMTALEALDKVIRANKAMIGFESEYKEKQNYESYGQSQFPQTVRSVGTVEELQNPYASHVKSRNFYSEEYSDFESWVVDGYKYSVTDSYYTEIYKSKIDNENYDLVAGAVCKLESIRDEIGTDPKADGITMQKENGMIRFIIDLKSFPKTMEKLEKAEEYRKFQLKVYVDEKTYKLKKVVEVFEGDKKSDQSIFKGESLYVIKGEFAGKIEVPEKIKKSAIPE
jgi:hypothetical protein